MSAPAATFQDGQLRWRGNYRSRDEMVRQARVFLLSASKGDWFRPFAHDYAEQCRRAVEAYDAAEFAPTTNQQLEGARP